MEVGCTFKPGGVRCGVKPKGAFFSGTVQRCYENKDRTGRLRFSSNKLRKHTGCQGNEGRKRKQVTAYTVIFKSCVKSIEKFFYLKGDKRDNSRFCAGVLGPAPQPFDKTRVVYVLVVSKKGKNCGSDKEGRSRNLQGQAERTNREAGGALLKKKTPNQ